MKFKLRDGIKYAMFDMDGTLLDTMMHWRTVGIEYMDERDIMRATPELFRQFAPAKYSGQYRMSYQNSEIDFSVIFEKMEKKYAALSPLTPGMDEALSDLRDRGISDCRVVGFDFLEKNVAALKEGIVQTIIAQHSDRQAASAVLALVDRFILGNDVARRDSFTQMDILNSINCDYYM